MKAQWIALLALAASPATYALTIDDFNTDQAALEVAPAGPNQAFSSASGAGILGLERDMELTVPGGLSPFGSTAAVEFGRFLLDNGSDSQATIHFQWDGPDGDPLNLDPTGLGAVDLTDGNTTNALEINFLFDDLPAVMTFTVYSGAGNSSTVTWPTAGLLLTGDTAISVLIPYSAFSGNADFTQIGAIEMELTSLVGNGLDVQIDYIQTALVPVPPALLLFGSSLIGLALRRRKASQ